MKTSTLRAALAVSILVSAGCGPNGCAAGDDRGDLIVFAAASLTEALSELAESFESEHPGVEVVLSTAGSQTLARQIVEGAPADVFASADAVQMQAVGDAGDLATEPRVFAANRLAIAVAADNPFGITGLADLADPQLVLVLPAAHVPAGRYAREALHAADVTITASSLERDVRAALAKVALGEADAAIVYASDLRAAGDSVAGVAIADEHNVAAAYPIAALEGARDPAAARAFVAYALGEQGQRIVRASGLAEP